jgi:hypothetical protein
MVAEWFAVARHLLEFSETIVNPGLGKALFFVNGAILVVCEACVLIASACTMGKAFKRIGIQQE